MAPVTIKHVEWKYARVPHNIQSIFQIPPSPPHPKKKKKKKKKEEEEENYESHWPIMSIPMGSR